MKTSVIIPVYNAAPFLEEAVQSALAHEEVQEILLIEDGSQDHSLEVAQQLAQKHTQVKVLQHPKGENRGAGASRNLGLDHASQEFIAFLDADDVYTDLRFKTEKPHFENPNIEGVFGAIGVRFLSDKGKENFEKKFKDLQLSTVNYPAEGPEVFQGLMLIDKGFGTFFSLIGLTVRKSSIEKHQLRFNEKLRVHQDTDFIRKLSYHCHLKSGEIQKAVALRGVHDDNRITQIDNYSPKYYHNQELLYQSTHEWARQQKAMDKAIQQHIQLQYRALQLANQKGIQKYLQLALSVIQNPKILKTRYRFHALNQA